MRAVAGFLVMIGGAMLATPANATCQVQQLLHFSVMMAGLQPMVSASVNGHDARFVADSGAFFSVISPGTAAEFGLKLTAAPVSYRLEGVGGDAAVKTATVKTLSVSGHDFHDILFIVAGSEVGGAGVLGQNFLGLADAEYDLAGGMIRLMRTHDCGNANLAYWSNGKPVSELPIQPAVEANRHTRGKVTLDGATIDAVFDTGAGTTVLNTTAAARAGVRPDTPGVIDAGYTSGLGRKLVHTWIGMFKELTIGDEKIQKIRLRFGDIGDSTFDMLIGADFFLSHRVYVDNARHRLFFTYNGGPVFDLKTRLPGPDSAGGTVPATAAPSPVPTAAAAAPPGTMTADDYARRGAGETARLDFAAALADLDCATALAPDNPEFRYQHAAVLADSRRLPAAREEVDRALALRPSYVEALMLRAALKLRDNDRAGAKADLDAVSAAVAKPADIRLALAGWYEALDAETSAIDQLDHWIAAHPDDSRLPQALDSRCWTRTLANVALPEAIADCNKSLRLRPHIAATLDSRGLAYLRSGDLDRATKDFDAALAIDPKLAWSLYGRGLIRSRRGDKTGGDADIAAAVAIRPGIARQAEHYGIAP